MLWLKLLLSKEKYHMSMTGGVAEVPTGSEASFAGVVALVLPAVTALQYYTVCHLFGLQ